MEISNKALLTAFLIVVALTGFTLYNIYAFMPDLAMCEDEFNLINTCGCVPCLDNFQDLFNQKGVCELPEIIK